MKTPSADAKGISLQGLAKGFFIILYAATFYLAPDFSTNSKTGASKEVASGYNKQNTSFNDFLISLFNQRFGYRDY